MRTNPLKEFSCYEYLFLSIINMLLSSENIASILFFFFFAPGFTSFYFQMYTCIKDKRLQVENETHQTHNQELHSDICQL